MKKLMAATNQKVCWGVLYCEIVLLFVFLFVKIWETPNWHKHYYYRILIHLTYKSLKINRVRHFLRPLSKLHRFFGPVCSTTTKLLHLQFVAAEHRLRCCVNVSCSRARLTLLHYRFGFRLEISTWHRFHLIRHRIGLLHFKCSPLKLFLDTFWLLSCLSLPNNLLLSEYLFISGIHLQECLQLWHADWLAVSLRNHVIKSQNQIKSLRQNILFLNIYT